MKKAGRILSLAVILIMLTTAVCFAAPQTGAEGGLNLIATYPEDGSKGAAIDNMGIKLYFDTQLTEDVLGNKNANAIQIVGPEGEKLPTRVLYTTKEEGVVLVIVDTDKEGKTIRGKSNAEYTVKVSGDFVADNGATLGKDMEFRFRTLNETTNNTVSMVMMFVMMGGITVFSARSMKKEMEKEKDTSKEAPVNPYKEAKRTGKSVEEIVEQDKKNKEKQAAKAAKKASRDEDDEYEEYLEEYLAMYEEEGKYKVKGPRPISAAGGTYITGRKAEAEARKAAEAEKKAQQEKWAANAKKGKGKKKK